MSDCSSANAFLSGRGSREKFCLAIETPEIGERCVYIHRYLVCEPRRDAESHGSGGVHQSDAVCGDRDRFLWYENERSHE